VEIFTKSVQIADDGNVSLLICEDQDVILSVDIVVCDCASIVGIEALLVLERNAMGSKQFEFLEHIFLF
jgi:hypothetical protein